MEQDPTRKAVILHVEDDDAAAYLFRACLREHGADVDVFRLCDGEDSILFLTRTGVFANAPQPDVVVLDLHMPKKNGHDVLAEIRQLTELEHLPVVMLSSSLRPLDRQKALALGANDYIYKSGDLDGLAVAVKRVLQYVPQRMFRGLVFYGD